MMTPLRLAGLLTCILAIAAVPLRSQRGALSYEVGGGVSLRDAVGTMSTIPGIPAPGPLSFVSDEQYLRGFGYAAVDMKLSNGFFGGIRLTAGSTFAAWKALERVPIAVADSVYAATIEHRLTANVTLVGLEPFLRWKATNSLWLDAGIPLMAILSATHRQTERFVDPAGLLFSDGSTQQVTSAGNVPGLRFMVPLVRLRLNYAISLVGNSWQLVPHVGAAVTPLSIHGDVAWRDVSFDVGLALRFSPQETVPPPSLPTIRTDTLYVRDTITVLQPGMAEPTPSLIDRIVGSAVVVNDTLNTITVTERYRKVLPKPPAILDGSIRVVFVDADGIERTDAVIETKRRKHARTVPMIPVVVFDTGSRIPDRYVRLTPSQAAAFADRDVIDTAAPHMQHNLLNTIGWRLRRKARISITLQTSGDTALGNERVAAVRAYLRATFGVDAKRIRHDQSTGGDTSQMVIVDPSCEVIGPITRVDTTVEATLPTVRMYPEVVADAPIVAWTVEVTSQGKTVFARTGSGPVPEQLTWSMRESVEAAQALQQTFDVRMTVADAEGGRVVTDPARVLLREAATMDASAGMQTSHEWITSSALPASFRLCQPTVPATAVYVSTVSLDSDGQSWWLRGVPPQERVLWQGPWKRFVTPADK
ncbi:MAG: hypothetical protein FGM24_00810 [Candidatus Kapabacteria bacterium]|nr:hypothetical protein [Candidatus Kapabacteria bacterium]